MAQCTTDLRDTDTSLTMDEEHPHPSPPTPQHLQAVQNNLQQQIITQWHLESPLVLCLVNFAPPWVDSERVCTKLVDLRPSIDSTLGLKRVAC